MRSLKLDTQDRVIWYRGEGHSLQAGFHQLTRAAGCTHPGKLLIQGKAESISKSTTSASMPSRRGGDCEASTSSSSQGVHVAIVLVEHPVLVGHLAVVAAWRWSECWCLWEAGAGPPREDLHLNSFLPAPPGQEPTNSPYSLPLERDVLSVTNHQGGRGSWGRARARTRQQGTGPSTQEVLSGSSQASAVKQPSI